MYSLCKLPPPRPHALCDAAGSLDRSIARIGPTAHTCLPFLPSSSSHPSARERWPPPSAPPPRWLCAPWCFWRRCRRRTRGGRCAHGRQTWEQSFTPPRPPRSGFGGYGGLYGHGGYGGYGGFGHGIGAAPILALRALGPEKEKKQCFFFWDKPDRARVGDRCRVRRNHLLPRARPRAFMRPAPAPGGIRGGSLPPPL